MIRGWKYTKKVTPQIGEALHGWHASYRAIFGTFYDQKRGPTSLKTIRCPQCSREIDVNTFYKCLKGRATFNQIRARSISWWPMTHECGAFLFVIDDSLQEDKMLTEKLFK